MTDPRRKAARAAALVKEPVPAAVPAERAVPAVVLVARS
jgi:hypothetical protein